MEETTPIHRLTVRGSAAERGRAVGRELTASVEAVLVSYGRRLEAWSGLAGAQLEAAGHDLGPGLKERSPQLLAFLEGVARGAGVSPGRVLACFAGYDLWLPEGRPAGCTSLAWERPAADGGRDLWLAQSFDWFSDLEGHMVLLTEVDEEGRVLSMGLTEAGLPPVAGMNGHGMTVLVNALTGTERLPGGPWAREVLWQALQFPSVERWLARAEELRPAAPLHLMVGDAGGDAAGCELGPRGNAFARPRDGTLLHTNHCRYPGYPEGADGMTGDDLGESEDRLRLASEGLAGLAQRSDLSDAATVEQLHQLYATHDPERYPRTLCCHPADGYGPLELAQTLAVMIVHPASRRTWLCSGNACRGRFEPIPWPDPAPAPTLTYPREGSRA